MAGACERSVPLNAPGVAAFERTLPLTARAFATVERTADTDTPALHPFNGTARTHCSRSIDLHWFLPQARRCLAGAERSLEQEHR